SRRRHTRSKRDWSSDVCSSDLGWSTGAISLQSPQRSQYSDDTITQQVLLGAVTAGSAQVPADSGHPDAGLSYAPANRYRATIHEIGRASSRERVEGQGDREN